MIILQSDLPITREDLYHLVHPDPVTGVIPVPSGTYELTADAVYVTPQCQDSAELEQLMIVLTKYIVYGFVVYRLIERSPKTYRYLIKDHTLYLQEQIQEFQTILRKG